MLNIILILLNLLILVLSPKICYVLANVTCVLETNVFHFCHIACSNNVSYVNFLDNIVFYNHTDILSPLVLSVSISY